MTLSLVCDACATWTYKSCLTWFALPVQVKLKTAGGAPQIVQCSKLGYKRNHSLSLANFSWLLEGGCWMLLDLNIGFGRKKTLVLVVHMEFLVTNNANIVGNRIEPMLPKKHPKTLEWDCN